MSENKEAYETKPLKLSDIFTPEQEAQLARILTELIHHKWGSVEIKIVEGKIQFFVPKPSIDVIRPGPTLTK